MVRMDPYSSTLQKECAAASGMMQKNIEQKAMHFALAGTCALDQWLRTYHLMIGGYGAWLNSNTKKQ
jgi:hypothetical protein